MAACISHMLDIRQPEIYGMEKGGTATPLICNGSSPPYVWAQEAAQDCTTSDDFISVSSGGSFPHSPFSSPRSAYSSLPGSPAGTLMVDDDNEYSTAQPMMMPSPLGPSPMSRSSFRYQGNKGCLFLDDSRSADDGLKPPPKPQTCSFIKDNLHRNPDESPGSFRGLLPSSASIVDSTLQQSVIDINGGRSSRSLLSNHHCAEEALLPSSPPRSATADVLKSTLCGHLRRPSLINTTEAFASEHPVASFGLRRSLITTTTATARQYHEPDEGSRRSHLLSPSFPALNNKSSAPDEPSSLPSSSGAVYNNAARPRAGYNDDDAPSASSSFRSRRRSSTSLRSQAANEIAASLSSTRTTTRTTTTTTTTTTRVHKSSGVAAASAFCSAASRFEPGIPPLPRYPISSRPSMQDEDSDAADAAAAAIDLRQQHQEVAKNRRDHCSLRHHHCHQDASAAADTDDAQKIIQHQTRPRNSGMVKSDGASSDQAIVSGGSSSTCSIAHHQRTMSGSSSGMTSPRGTSADANIIGLRGNHASSAVHQQHCCGRYEVKSSNSASIGLGAEHHQLKQPIGSGYSVISTAEDSSIKISSRARTSIAAVASSVLERDTEKKDGDAVAASAAPWTSCGDDGISIGSDSSGSDSSCVIDRFLEVCRDSRITAALATLDFKRRLPFLGPVLPRSASVADATDGMLEAEEARPPSIKGTITALWALLAKTGMLHEECSVTAVFTALWILESFNDNRRRKATTVLRDYLECTPGKGSRSSRMHRGPGDVDSHHGQDSGSSAMSPPEFTAARPSALAVEMLREPMVKTQAAILSRCGWRVRLDEADLSLALSDLTTSPARSISFNRTILECYEISHGRKKAAAAVHQLCPTLQQKPQNLPDARVTKAGVMSRGDLTTMTLGFLRRL